MYDQSKRAFFESLLQPEYPLSDYQLAVLEEVHTGSGNLIIEAVAGSGKTTILKLINQLILYRDQGKALVTAFNKHIQREIEPLVQPSRCATIHSIGMGMLRKWESTKQVKIQVSQYKAHDLARPFVEQEWIEARRNPTSALQHWIADNLNEDSPWDIADQMIKAVAQASNLCRATLTPRNDIERIKQLIGRYALDVHVDAAEIVSEIVYSSERVAKTTGEIDFTDMIYLPVFWKLESIRYSWLLVDEAQDLNPCQLEIIGKMISRNGRIIFCGDSKQAIYAFAGASGNCFDIIGSRFKTKALPLSVCYRCNTLSLDAARVLVPQIENAPKAKPGIAKFVTEDQIYDMAQAGDIILSRINAPLVMHCIALIKDGTQARIKGSNIATQLVKFIDKSIGKKYVGKGKPVYADFPDYFRRYRDAKLAQLERQQYSDGKIAELQDTYAAVQACYQGFEGCTDRNSLADHITDLFSDARAAIWLSTIHKSKGLEADRVFILDAHELPSNRGKTAEALQQERNLLYIAMTRAKQATYFVGDNLTVGADPVKFYSDKLGLKPKQVVIDDPDVIDAEFVSEEAPLMLTSA